MIEVVISVILLVVFATLVFGIVYTQVLSRNERHREQRYRAEFVKRHRQGL